MAWLQKSNGQETKMNHLADLVAPSLEQVTLMICCFKLGYQVFVQGSGSTIAQPGGSDSDLRDHTKRRSHIGSVNEKMYPGNPVAC